MPVMGFVKFERFFRVAGGVTVDRDDVKRYLDFVNDALYDLLLIGQAAAKANPSVEVLFGAGTTGTDPASEIAKVQNMLAQGIKVLVIAPQGPGLIPVLNRAVSQGVKVIFVDTKIPGWNKAVSFIGTDNAASPNPTIAAVPTNRPNRMRTKFQTIR